MKDLNGNTIQAGDIVEIRNAYFKNDNGFWFVEQDGTNEAYLGKDLTLKKICKNGKISKSKKSICFYPLKSFVNDAVKRYEADEWNKENATIQISKKIKNDEVLRFFEEKKQEHAEALEYYEIRGYGEAWTEPHKMNVDYCERTIKRLA